MIVNILAAADLAAVRAMRHGIREAVHAKLRLANVRVLRVVVIVIRSLSVLTRTKLVTAALVNVLVQDNVDVLVIQAGQVALMVRNVLVVHARTLRVNAQVNVAAAATRMEVAVRVTRYVRADLAKTHLAIAQAVIVRVTRMGHVQECRLA